MEISLYIQTSVKKKSKTHKSLARRERKTIQSCRNDRSNDNRSKMVDDKTQNFSPPTITTNSENFPINTKKNKKSEDEEDVNESNESKETDKQNKKNLKYTRQTS